MPTRDILHTLSRRTILATGIGLIVVLLAATAVVLIVLRSEEFSRAEWHLGNLATALGEQTRQSMQSIDLAVATTAEELRDRDAGRRKIGNAELYEHIQERIRTLPQLRVIAIVDRRGDAVLHSSRFPAPAVNYADREYFQAHRDRGVDGLYIGAPVLGRVIAETGIVFSRRLEDGRGEFSGIVFAAVALPYFEGIYRGLNLGAGGRAFLLRSDGVLLATYPPVESAIGRALAQDPLFAGERASSASGAYRRPGMLDQEPRVLAYSRLEAYPLLVAISSTEDFILREWRRDAWRIGAGAAGVTAIIALGLILLLRQYRVADELAREVRGSEKRWLAAMEAAGHGVWDWDVRSGEVYRSPHYHEMLGYSMGEVGQGGAEWQKLLHPDDRQLAHQLNRECLEGRTDTFSADLRLRCKDGGWKWVLNRGTVVGRDEHGRALRVLGTITDLTEHRLAQQLLRESEARLNGIIASAMDAVITVDGEQRIVLFNEAAEKTFRCPAREAIGERLDRFIPERFRKAHRRHIEHFGSTGTSSRQMGTQLDLWGLRADGEEFPIDASISHVVVSGKRFYAVILRDITQRKRAEEELERSREELRELSAAMNEVREAERTRIARELHDELAQWLTALRMDVSWLAGRLPDGQRQFRDRTEKMKQLLDATVASVRRIAADLRPAMLDDLGLVPAVEHLLHDLSQRTGVVVSLEADSANLDLGEPVATSVYRMVQEALTNVARHAGATEVLVTMGYEGEHLVVRVRDNGRGFDAEAAARRKSYGVLGIRERAHTLGGSARIARLETGGTLVEILIPVARYSRREAVK